MQSSLTGDRLQLDFIGEVQTGGQLCRGVGQPCADHSDVDRLARRLPLHRQKGRLVDGGRQLLGVDGGVGSGVGVGHVDVRDAAVGAYGLDGECSRVRYYSAVGANGLDGEGSRVHYYSAVGAYGLDGEGSRVHYYSAVGAYGLDGECSRVHYYSAVGAYGLDGECSRVHYYSAVGALVPTVELLRRRRRVLFIKGKIMPRDTTISA